MKKALVKAETYHNLDGGVLEKFEMLIKNIQDISKENEEINSKLTDIPEEFICPISCDLMKDPVYLPTSGNVMEKSIIKQILLNDEHDPFNRAPLKFSQIQDQPDLKAKIEIWIKKKLSGETIEEENIKLIQKTKFDKMEVEEEKQNENENENENEDYDPFRWAGKKFK